MISEFRRIDTVTVPDRFMSVIKVSESGGADIEDIREKLESDKDSLDYLAVISDTDPLDFDDLYRTIKSVRPKGLKVMIVTDGRNPGILDDLVGAGYAHAMDLLIGREITREQKECIELILDNRCKFAITLKARDHDENSVSTIAKACRGCSMVIFKQDRSDPLKGSDMSKLTSAAKACSWNVKTI